MSETATPETAAERVLREIAEGVDRFVDKTADEAAATARLIATNEARIRALDPSTTERTD